MLLLVLAAAVLVAPPELALDALTGHGRIATYALAGAVGVSGLAHRPGVRWTRAVASLGLVVWAVATLLQHDDAPARGLIVMLGAIGVLAAIWSGAPFDLSEPDRETSEDRTLLSGGLIGLALGLDAWGGGARPRTMSTVALGLVYALPVIHAFFGRVGRSRRRRLGLALALATASAPVVGTLGLLPGVSADVAPVGLLAPLLTIGSVLRGRMVRAVVPRPELREPGLLDAVLVHPSRFLVVSFVGLCGVGTLLLTLPVMTADGSALSWIDAAFTAVSATCVTGLIVVDTPVAFGGVGQAVVLLLIQVGGLGIMVFSAAALVLVGKRLSLSHERAAVELVGASGHAGLVRAIRGVLLVTTLTELAGAALLLPVFLASGDGMGEAVWRALFTSISAFCNAGFALQSDSLVPFADNPYVLGVVAATIVVGGLGPVVVAALVAPRDRARRTLHVRLVLWTTAILLVVPAVLIAGLEWNGALAGMSWSDKLANAAFQSVTLRTAGFNSIDLATVRPATWTLMILLMYVGGSPGSTAGGVKTTTIAVVLLAVAAVVRGRDRVVIFGRRLAHATVLRATAVTTLAVLGCCLALATLQLTVDLPLDVALFEVVSALATVGLTVGGTAELDEVGKAIVMVCMFTGRVGPLTLFVFLTSKPGEAALRTYPEEPVPIG